MPSQSYVTTRAAGWLHKVFSRIREWCGDAAYERYVRSAVGKQERNAVLSPEEFYLEQINRRYSQPNRCC